MDYRKTNKKILITYNKFVELLRRLISGNKNYAGFFNYIKNPDVINTMVKIINKVHDNKLPAFNLTKLLMNLNEKVKKLTLKR